MVKLALYLKATMEGVTGLEPKTEGDAPDEYYYAFQVQCTSCRETHPNYIQVSRHERSEMSGSRGDAHFVWKCKNCGRESSANLDGPPTPYTTSGKPSKFITFETRGCEFVSFQADGVFKCISTSSGKKKTTVFEEVELADGEWYDYDDSAASEVSITEVEWSIARA